MPLVLDTIDIAIIKAMVNDARKSFRQVALELGFSEHVVKKRFDRMANVGLIKSVSLILDLSKIENTELPVPLAENLTEQEISSVKKGAKVSLQCDYCNGPITGNPLVLQIADYERYFCCVTCRNTYSEKHKSRINSLVKRYLAENRPD